jgi:hypothetical protein
MVSAEMRVFYMCINACDTTIFGTQKHMVNIVYATNKYFHYIIIGYKFVFIQFVFAKDGITKNIVHSVALRDRYCFLLILS